MTCCNTSSPQYLTHLRSNNSVSVYFNGVDPLIISNTNPMYNEICEKLGRGIKTGLYEIVNLAARIKHHTKGKFNLVEKDGVDVIMLYNKPMPKALSDLVIKFVDAKLPTEALERFWENLSKNPSEESRQSLYSFIEVNNMTLTDDGCFIGYRAIRENWTDQHTGKMDNSIGATVKINRNDVDADPNNTCSTGLHIAAWDYAYNNFGGKSSSHRMIEVKVNPKDVVTVPPDYNQQKMRVCEFKVLREVSSENKTVLHPDTFAVDLNDDDSVEEQFYSMSVCSNGGVNIPSALVKQLGAKTGDNVYVSYDEMEDIVVVTPSIILVPDDCDFRAYTVDRNNSARLGPKALPKEWNLETGDSVTAGFVSGRIEIWID